MTGSFTGYQSAVFFDVRIKNLLVQLVLCMLNKQFAHNLPPYSAPLNCSILWSGSRPL